MKTFVWRIVTVSDGAGRSVTVSKRGWRNHQCTVTDGRSCSQASATQSRGSYSANIFSCVADVAVTKLCQRRRVVGSSHIIYDATWARL
jgi:hypothetical protein